VKVLSCITRAVWLAFAGWPLSLDIKALELTDLPEGCFTIEAEQFDYGGGEAVDAVNTMPYTGTEYEGLSAVPEVDYHRNQADIEGDVYRLIEDPNVPMFDNRGGQLGIERPGFEVATNYRIGHIAGGEWYNYTRAIPPGSYKVYAALSHKGTIPGLLRARLGVVTAGAGTQDQKVTDLGEFNAPGSGGWGMNVLVPLLDANGYEAVFRPSPGQTTLRFSTLSGDFDWFTLAPALPTVTFARPFPGETVVRDVELSFVITDYQSAVAPATIKLFLDDQDITVGAQILSTAEGAVVHYTLPSPLDPFTQHSYILRFQDNAANPHEVVYTGVFSVSVFSALSFIVEAEDFNFAGGESLPEASHMPYMGGAYDGLGAVPEVDYHSNDHDPNYVYRKGESLGIDIVSETTFLNRGAWAVTVNYTIGSVNDGDWQNYTRIFPPATYEVYAALANKSAEPHAMRGKLQKVVSGADSTNQSLVDLGLFDAAGTGAWDLYAFAPLTDTDGHQVKVALAGGETLRWTGISGNLDCLVLVPAGGAIELADLMIGTSSGVLTGDNVYQTVPSGVQVATQTIAANAQAVFNVKVRNAGAAPHRLVVQAEESADPGWTVIYRASGADVSAQVRGADGHVTALLPPGGSEILVVQMTPGPALFASARKETRLKVFPGIRVTPLTDSVKAVAITASTTQPDLLVRRETDAIYRGDNIYNLSGAGQTAWQEVQANETSRFLLHLQNDGNGIDQFVFKGPNGTGGWEVRYYARRRALVFDGNKDYVDCGAGWSAGEQWTIEAWVKPQAVLAGRRSIAGAYGDCRDWGITFQDGQFGLVTGRPGDCTATILSGVAPRLNTWYHVAGTCDATNTQVFVNGELKASEKLVESYCGTESGFGIGGEVQESDKAANHFPGVVREVRVWNRALTAEEVRLAMNWRLKGDEPGLVGYWPLDECNGRVAHDRSGHEHDGTLENSPGWGTMFEPADLFEVTASVTSAGWTNTPLYPAVADEFVVEVVPDRTVTAGAVQELFVMATSTSDQGKSDAVRLVTALADTGATPAGGTYTTSADFEKGRCVGVEYDSVADQLQLAKKPVTLPYLWVPNSNEATVSKVDTRTGRELARYRTCPRTDANPSRTTVDQQGNCWLGNRQRGTVVKIGLLENGQCVDRNGNGRIDTSYDRDNDGNISPDELLPWGEDECVLCEILMVTDQEQTYTPGTDDVPYANDYWNPGPRGLAVDARGNVWVGTYGSERFYYLSGATGRILQINDLHAFNHTSYGAIMSGNGVLWSAGYNRLAIDQSQLLRFDPQTGEVTIINLGHATYGLGLDYLGHLFVAGWQNSKLSRIDVATGRVDWTHEGLYESRGVVVTEDNDVWVANSAPGTVARWSNDGQIKTQIVVGTTPTGVAVDAAGKVWVVNYGDEFIRRIDPATDSIDLSKRIVGALHYGYSDMTGIISRQITTRLGTWSVIHNAQMPNTPWDQGAISWHSDEPSGTSIKAQARTSNDQITWSVWQDLPNCTNGTRLTGLIPGRFIEVQLRLQSDAADMSPVLKDLTITPGTRFDLGLQAYFNDFEIPAGSEWSDTRTATSPIGQRTFLGPFANQAVTLSLDSLPSHTAITVAFDLFVLGRWDGNDLTPGCGPDLIEVRLADGLVLAHTTFNNGHPETAAAGQAFPDNYPEGNHPPHTGASEINRLGFTEPGHEVMDSVYHLQYTFPHTARAMKFVIEARTEAPADLSLPPLVSPSEATWGLDNFQVNVTRPLSKPASQLMPLGFSDEGFFQMRLAGVPQTCYVVEFSCDFESWIPVVTNLLQSDHLDLADPQSPVDVQRFYRARSVE
jgi:hypothetical protein